MTYKHCLILFFVLLAFSAVAKITQSETSIIARFSGKFVSSGTQSSNSEITLHGVIGDINSSQMKSDDGTLILFPQNLTLDTPSYTIKAFLPSVAKLPQPPTPTPTPCLAQDIEPTNDKHVDALMLDSICIDGSLIQGYIEEVGSGGDENDIYWLNLTSPKRLKFMQENVSGQSSTNFAMAIFDEEQKLIEPDLNQNETIKEIEHSLGQGIYFIYIRSIKGNGNYELSVTEVN